MGVNPSQAKTDIYTENNDLFIKDIVLSFYPFFPPTLLSEASFRIRQIYYLQHVDMLSARTKYDIRTARTGRSQVMLIQFCGY